MKFFQRKNTKSGNISEQMRNSKDFKHIQYINEKTGTPFSLIYLETLVDDKTIKESALPPLLKEDLSTIEDVKKILPIPGIEILDDLTGVEEKLLQGYVLLKIGEEKKYCLFLAVMENTRTISIPEVEFSVIGPKEAFVESLEQNLHLIRKRLPTEHLMIEELTVGKISKTKVALIYIEGIADPENVNTLRQRIKDIHFDTIPDSSFIEEMISDNALSPFPQILDTERPDRVSAVLSEGKISVIVDGSPHALIAPATVINFISAFEDYFLNWGIASFIRLIRVFAVTFSILATPTYVAVLTYHYELIPQDLFSALITSRRVVPFPPILEALFLELTIELLREAGARLPTKVGQTIGIVGGIVIGTASVEAGLTSNVLLIIIALAALSSFTTPIYKMGNTIRLIRFPFLLFAQLWGLLGIVVCFSFVLTHLIRLTSIGRPILEPLYPLRTQDLKDSLIRLPFSALEKRPFFLKPGKKVRFKPKKRKKKNKDIDE